MTNNPMNPENIQAGDYVKFESPTTEWEKKEFLVTSVGGRFGNKVYCREIGQEYYASVFRKVKKGKQS